MSKEFINYRETRIAEIRTAMVEAQENNTKALADRSVAAYGEGTMSDEVLERFSMEAKEELVEELAGFCVQWIEECFDEQKMEAVIGLVMHKIKDSHEQAVWDMMFADLRNGIPYELEAKIMSNSNVQKVVGELIAEIKKIDNLKSQRIEKVIKGVIMTTSAAVVAAALHFCSN